MKYIFKNNLILMSALIVLSFLLIYLTNSYILTNDFYEKSAQPFAGDPAFGNQVYQGLQIWIYPAAALYIIIKAVTIALILYTALYLSSGQAPFNRVFHIVIRSEYIFLVPAVIKIAWFYSHRGEGDLLSWQRFYPGSVLSLFPAVPADWYYVLQTLNVFEIGYWFLLAWGLSKISDRSYDRSLQLVLTSYLPALIIWVAMITFCSLLLFPLTG